MKSKRVYALYVRVSTHKQDARYQVKVLKDYLKKHDPGASYEIFEDVATGSNTDRPAFTKLMHERNRFTDVAVVKMDRWGRSLSQCLETLELLKQSKVNFIAVQQNLDLSSPQGRMMAQILQIFSEYERAAIIDRVNAGLAHARANGVVLGRPRKQVDEAKVKRLLRTKSLREVAKEMKVSKSTVDRISKGVTVRT